MAFVVDASVALAWCFEDESDEYADQIIDRMTVEPALVPAIWPVELANALLVAERKGRIDPIGRTRLADLLSDLPHEIASASLDEAVIEVARFAAQHGLSAYDASYLHLAIREGLPVATLDVRLRRAAEAEGVPLAS